jgi:hypothetical protein
MMGLLAVKSSIDAHPIKVRVMSGKNCSFITFSGEGKPV